MVFLNARYENNCLLCYPKILTRAIKFYFLIWYGEGRFRKLSVE